MRKQHDFTQGNILKQLIAFSGPIMLTNLLQTSYQFADSLWVGNFLGASALGSVAVSSTIIFTVLSLLGSVAVSSTIICTVLSFVICLNNAALTIFSHHNG